MNTDRRARALPRKPLRCAVLALGLALCGLLGACAGGASPGADPEPRATGRRPNIVLILADDLGYGDVSAYGQRRFTTPNIDRLATEGIRFTDFYAGSTVCAPSRSALMTGQHTGHTFIRANPAFVAPEKRLAGGMDYPLPDSVVTMAEMLKRAGYTTGGFGKWGLGYPGSEGDAVRQGFDRFFGYLSHSQAHYFFPEYLWDDQTKVPLPGNLAGGMRTYSHALIQERALAFLDRNRDRPFFLYLPYTIPHAELLVPRDTMLERFEALFGEAPLPEAKTTRERYGQGYGTPERPRAARAAMLTHLDRSVGQVLRRLQELGLDENTIVLFSSDNGPSSEGRADLDFFDSNGPLRGGKRDLYEGGIRVPLLARWPGTIPPGGSTAHPAALWDLLPTLAEVAGATPPKGIDGVSLVPTLLGRPGQPAQPSLYWEFHERGGKQAVRRDNWKAVRLNVIEEPNAAIELYDLATDAAEERNVAARNPEIVAEMKRIMARERWDSEVFPALNRAGDNSSGGRKGPGRTVSR